MIPNRTFSPAPLLIALLAVPTRAEQPATVLLITAKKLAVAWQPFARWKTLQGLATKIITVEDIARAYQGEDIQQRIRACVLEHIAHRATQWVILGGDSEPGGGVVPDRDSAHPSRRYRDIPTDLYYLSEKSWDGDNDGVYGEWSADRAAISYGNAAACIGRIPVRTPAQVRAYTEKVIAYESRYPAGEFARRFVITCPEPSAYPKLGTSRAQIARVWKGGELLEFFASKTPWDEKEPGDHDLSAANWVKMINASTAGKMHMHGHGFLPAWILEKRSLVDAKVVAKLRNRDAYLALSTVSCFTGQYDGAKDPSIAEALLRQPGAGAVLIVAPSREGVPIFHSRSDFRLMITEGKMDGTTELLTRFWQHGLGEGLTAGEALSAARKDLLPDAARSAGYHWCLCELNLLGDPTLDLRAAPVRTPAPKLPARLSSGEQTLVFESGAPGARVCLWKEPEIYAVARADERGAVRVKIHPASAGELLVTIAGANLNTVTRKVAIDLRQP